MEHIYNVIHKTPRAYKIIWECDIFKSNKIIYENLIYSSQMFKITAFNLLNDPPQGQYYTIS